MKGELLWGYDDIIAIKDHSPVGLAGQKVGVHRKIPTFASSGEAGLESMLIFYMVMAGPCPPCHGGLSSEIFGDISGESLGSPRLVPKVLL